MRKFVILAVLILMLAVPVSGEEFTAPTAPEDAQTLLPTESVSFGKDLWTVVCNAVSTLQPQLREAAGICLSLVAVSMLVSCLRTAPASSGNTVEFAGTLAVAAILLVQTNTLIHLAADTVQELSQYGKLLLPVMTAAMAAQGSITASGALYAGTALFDALLSSGINSLLVPMVYVYLALSVAAGAVGEEILGKLRDLVKGITTWSLKTVLYIFTGYMGITGVVSGATDAAALKATKLTMSGAIPVVGGILSDASEAVIVGAQVVKNTAGVAGLLAVAAIWISPFLRIGVQYLLLKLTAGLCEMFGVKRINSLIKSFSTAMGLLLGMTGAVCVMLMVSTVCFMKGAGS